MARLGVFCLFPVNALGYHRIMTVTIRKGNKRNWFFLTMAAFDVKKVLDGYDKDDLSVVTVCSHSSLQIFHGAKKEGLRTLGIAVGRPPKLYDAFPMAKPDDFLVLDTYDQIPDHVDDIISDNGVVIPHGSFVEYLGASNFKELPIPTFGNRKVLEWESDRNIEREWLLKSGIHMPNEVKDPKTINKPVMVKYQGAKGGRGFFIAKDYNQFKLGIDHSQKFTIQEYILGTRYYLHYFHSPLREDGYKVLSNSCPWTEGMRPILMRCTNWDHKRN